MASRIVKPPAFASLNSVQVALTQYPYQKNLRPVLLQAAHELDAALDMQGLGQTTLTVSRFFRDDGQWRFQHACVGNSRSLLLAKPHSTSAWQLVSMTDEDTLVDEIQKITTLLTRPADSEEIRARKVKAFEYWLEDAAFIKTCGSPR